jgi:hypothetical protein
MEEDITYHHSDKGTHYGNPIFKFPDAKEKDHQQKGG